MLSNFEKETALPAIENKDKKPQKYQTKQTKKPHSHTEKIPNKQRQKNEKENEKIYEKII